MKKIIALLLRHEYLIWILCLSTLLHIPSLFEPYWYGDEGIYLTLGNGVRHGLELYRDIHDNKPPILYMLAAISGSVFWFRFLLILWNSASVIVFYRLSHIVLGTPEKQKGFLIGKWKFPPITLPVIATLLFAVLPTFAEGNIANGEIFMVLPTLLGMWILWKGVKHPSLDVRVRSSILAGLFFSVAFLIKVPALFDALAAGIFFFIFSTSTKNLLQTWIKRIPNILAFSVAFLAPILLTVIYYSALGVGDQYVKAAFAQNVGYLSSWSGGAHEASKLGQSGLMNRGIALLIAVCFLFLFQKRYKPVTIFLFLWFGFSLFGALLSERPYPHYLIQVLPPLCLLLVYFLKHVFTPHREKWSSLGHVLHGVTIAGCFVIFFVSLTTVKFWYYPQLPYYQNFLSFARGEKPKNAYFSYFDPRMPSIYMTANKIIVRTTPKDRIFIWGDLPSLYALSRRLPPGRYTSNYHIKDFNGWDETFAAIKKTRPKLIIIDPAYEAPPEALSALLAQEYAPLMDRRGALMVYKLQTP